MFIIRLLEAMGYNQAIGDDAISVDNYIIPFDVCDQTVSGSAMMVIAAGAGHIPVIVQTRKGDCNQSRVPHAELIAMAIGAFQSQAQLAHDARVVPAASHYIQYEHAPRNYAGIMLTGTLPVFFKIQVTTQLARAVAEGTPAKHATVVRVYSPPVAKRLHEQHFGT
jgi:hypothetical protein